MKSYIERARREFCHDDSIIPVILLRSNSLEIMIYKSPHGDYIVDDTFCTCKSFAMSLAKRTRRPCKHMCATKKVVKAINLDIDDLYEIVMNILVYGYSNLLRILEKEVGEKGRGQKEEKEESN